MQNPNADSNLKILEKIYTLYDEAVLNIPAVCREKCSSCCTCNVTMTSLEAGYLSASLQEEEKDRLKKRIAAHAPLKKYVPKMTTNGFARSCMEGKQIPEEENDPSWGKCPALQDDLCSVYDVRPLGCRALMSQTFCDKLGYARVPPVVLTINNLFMQVIEQLDHNGVFGNFSDMVPPALSGIDPGALRQMALEKNNTCFILNEKITVLMVEPEHRSRLSGLLEKLSSLM